MDSLNISTGEKRLLINGDPSRVIAFNPSDVLFAEKFYKLIGEYQERLKAYQAQALELDADSGEDEHGLPSNMGARLDLVKAACNFTYEKIDSLFGPGTSQAVFQGALSLDAVKQFFDGIAPHIQTARAEKIAKYTNKRPRRNGKKQ